jgi:hypothetical protein
VTPIEALRAARHLGLEIEAVGDTLRLSASLSPPFWLLAALRLHKHSILALLRPDGSGWTGEDWVVFCDERAAILEYDQSLSRLEAEICAQEQTEMARKHPGFLLPAEARRWLSGATTAARA